MARRIGKRDVLWLSLLSGAFVLLAVQVFLGSTSGFGRPHAGLFARLLEAPGIVLGWGGVALCVVAIPYALVSWTRGRSPGRALTVFGTLVCAVGVAGLAGVVAATPVRGGGAIGGALAHMLSDALGSTIAFLVTVGIAIPGLLLALGPLILDTSPLGPGRPKGPEAKAWYPKPLVGPDGVEVPMALPGTDVGPIRYREPEPAEPPPPPPPPEPLASARAPTISGVRYADGGDDEGTPASEPAPAVRFAPDAAEGASEDDLPFGVRFATPSGGAGPATTEAASPFVHPTVDAAPSAAPPEPAVEPAKEPPPPPLAKPPRRPRKEPPVAEVAVTLSPPQPSVTSHRDKLANSGVFEHGRPDDSRGGRPAPAKPKPAKAQSIRDALRGLFTNLPVDELPPARTPDPEDDKPAAPPPPPDAPGQLSLFGSSKAAGKSKAAVAHPAAKDELFPAAVDAALERGTASLVLLKRKLNVGYARAESLMDALVAEGILGEMTASGSRPTLITSREWHTRSKREQ